MSNRNSYMYDRNGSFQQINKTMFNVFVFVMFLISLVPVNAVPIDNVEIPLVNDVTSLQETL